MHITISNPDLVRFIEQQVTEGRFDSIEEVVEAAIALLLHMDDDAEELSEQTLASIREANAQCERGEGRDFREALLELRRKFDAK
jgi:Arc/MetJ-type ribon-helix-helix transcriptional regulator